MTETYRFAGYDLTLPLGDFDKVCWYPNYGCSRYALQDGDVVEWPYTCDLGFDVGGGYAVGGTTESDQQKEEVP